MEKRKNGGKVEGGKEEVNTDKKSVGTRSLVPTAFGVMTESNSSRLLH